MKSVYGLVYALMIPRGARNASGAYQAAVLLTSPFEQAYRSYAYWSRACHIESACGHTPDPIAAVAYAEALYSKGWLSPLPAGVDAIFSGMIGNVISGRSSLSAALVSAEQSLNALLQ